MAAPGVFPMSERNVFSSGLLGRGARLASGGLVLLALAAPSQAYVVVTSDNRVFDVESKPQVSGDLILFTLDGYPVSLRMYDVNLSKTNEMNHLFDSGGSASGLQAQVRALRPAIPQDDRIIVSSRLERMLDREFGEDAGIARREMAGEMTSFDRNVPGGARRAEAPRPFEREARDAMSEAEQRVRRPADDRDEPVTSGRRGRASARDTGRVADLDAEIAAEQDYLRKLTDGELTVSDLEGEIDRSMAKIKRLQRRRDDMAAGSSSMAESSGSQSSGNYPAGSREARWERELLDAQGELARLQSQQSAASGSAREREGIDERIGELQWKIDRLRRRLGE